MSSAPRYRLLSYPIKAASPMYGNAPQPAFIPYSQIAKGNTSNSCVISIYNHTGTHIDAPKHFIYNGKSISDYSIEELFFKNPIIVDCPKNSATLITPDDLQHAMYQLKICDCLLLHTGYGQFRNEEKYRTHNPGIAPETILWIREDYSNIRCIGIDCISISSFQHRNEGREAHKIAFIEQSGQGAPLLLIEDMKLDMILGESIEKMFIIPWQIEGIDSAPCNIIATIKN
jgi:kynurenine formamidase